MARVIKVLVVDDSAYVRKVVTQMLQRSPFIEVVGTARDGEEALEQVEKLTPDVVTLDLLMPKLDGLGFLRAQFRRHWLPVIIVSIANEAGEMALRALDAGAIDFIQKPTALATDKIYDMNDELVGKVKMAAQVSPARTTPAHPAPPSSSLFAAAKHPRLDVVVLGISTGGPQALKQLIPQLPADLPVPVLMVMHMPVGYTALYAERLNEMSDLRVKEAGDCEALQPGTAYLAPAGHHLSVMRRPDGTVVTQLSLRPYDTPHRPAVDVLFQSAATTFGEGVLGIVMTGMGSDGCQGAAWIKAQGGLVLTETEESCVVYGMPRAVVEAGLSDGSVPLTQMKQAIVESVEQGRG